MADRKAVDITRFDVIIPETFEYNDYGDLLITTTNGQEIKVNKKHEKLHDGIIEAAENGRAVKLGYAVYMNKEYVHTAELYDGAPEKPSEPKKASLTEQAVEMGGKHIATVQKLTSDEIKNRSVAISYSKDLCCAGKIDLKDLSAYADKFLAYIEKRN